VRDGQTHPHRPRLVVSHSTCPPLSPPPNANSFVIGPAVIKHTHTFSRQGATGVPLFTTWDPVAGSGRAPIAWKHFGPEPTRAIEPQHRPPGQQWILGEGLRGGGPSRPPFWRTPKESCKGLVSSVTFRNKQSTHTWPGNAVGLGGFSFDLADSSRISARSGGAF
jgi:hypothetical protein